VSQTNTVIRGRPIADGEENSAKSCRMGMGKCNNEQFHNFREIKATRMIRMDELRNSSVVSFLTLINR